MKKYVSLGLVLIAAVFFAALAVNASDSPKEKGGAVSATAVYKANCARCHGADGKGIKSLDPPDFTNAEWQSKQTDAGLLKAINDGVGVMPGYKSTLKPLQIKALVKYVRSFAKK
jgi:cbb3-type cytochrome c oxidase subunit III